jgi:hypothetical protein
MFTPLPEPADGGFDQKTYAAGSPYRNVADKRSISMLGLGMVIGAAIGAGIALVAAPRSGEDTRDRILERVRRLRSRDDSTWEKLGRELRRAAKVRRLELVEKRARHAEAAQERERAGRDSGAKPA